jgi:hypothetical protein
MYNSTNIVRVFKLRGGSKMRRACSAGMENENSILNRESREKRPIGRSRLRCEGNI